MNIIKSDLDPLLEKLMKNLSEHIDMEEVTPPSNDLIL
jgi:hypothetical protein